MAWYRASTVTVTNGSKTVTGASTAWINNVQPGDAFIGPDGVYNEVDVVGSNTSLTLVEDYAGTTASGAAYKIIPTQGRVRDMAAAVLQLISDYSALDSTFTLDAGNVGIGASPLSKFDIYNAGNNYLYVRSAATSSAGIEIAGNGNTVGAGSLALAQASDNNAYLMQRADADLFLGAKNDIVMTLRGSGNVGIGTTSPTYKLHVVGPSLGLVNTYGADSAFTVAGTASSGVLGADAAGVYIAANSAAPVRFITSGVVRLSVEASGQINLVPLASDPAGAGAGDMYFNDTTGKFRGHTGSGWVDLN